MDEVRVEYKGMEIEYSEWGNNWNVRLDGELVKSDCLSLGDGKKAADDFLKKSRTFKELEAWFEDGSWRGEHKFKKVRVTSFIESGKECWITRENKNRSKESVNSVFVVTPQNEQLIQEIKELKTQIKTAEETVETKRKQLVRISLKMGDEITKIGEG